MTQNKTNRRRFLATAAGVGIVSTAGCLGLFEGDNTGGGGTTTPTETESVTDTPTETETEETEASDSQTETATEETNASVDEYLADTGNYDGTIEDNTSEDSIDVMVGAEGNGPGAQAFDPVVTKVSPGTTVTWVWTGDGGRHKIVHEGGEFSSGGVSASGFTYEHTFDEPGTYLYYCDNHTEVKMRGAIIVTDS